METNLDAILEGEKYPLKVKELGKCKFKQQNLNAWRPIPTFEGALMTFLVLGSVLLVVGITILVLSAQIFEKNLRYDNSCDQEKSCTKTFVVDTIIPNLILSEPSGTKSSRSVSASWNVNDLNIKSSKLTNILMEQVPYTLMFVSMKWITSMAKF